MLEIIRRYKRVIARIKSLPQLSEKEKRRLICVAWCEEVVNFIWKAPIIIPFTIIGSIFVLIGMGIQAIANVLDAIGYVFLEIVNAVLFNFEIGFLPREKINNLMKMMKENNKF